MKIDAAILKQQTFYSGVIDIQWLSVFQSLV